MSESESLQLKRRFGRIGELLGDVLSRRLLLVLIRLICEYRLFPPAWKDATVIGVEQIGNFGEENGSFAVGCEGLAFTNEQELLVACYRRVQAFTTTGESSWFTFARRVAQGHFTSPRQIAVDADAKLVFIADEAACHVVVCALDGRYVRTIASKGSGDGQFAAAFGVVVGGGHVFVSDCRANRVTKLKRDGEFVTHFGSDHLQHARGMALNRFGELAVSNGARGDFQLFDLDGKFLRSVTHSEQFNAHSITCDHADNWLLTDCTSHRVLCFTRDGTFITAFSRSPGGPAFFSYPYAICVDIEGRVFVGDSSNRVQVFTFGGAGGNAVDRTLAMTRFNRDWEAVYA